jgi:lipoyl(octanoyl) transferase
LGLVQPPDDVQPMPAALNCAAALAWLTAPAGGASASVPARASPRPAMAVRVPEKVVMPFTPTSAGRLVNVAEPLKFEVVGTGAGAVDYLDAWELQRRVHAEVVAGERPDTVLLLEHPPTYTAGKRTEPHERPADSGGAPVIEVDRGGKITFHGPGQLVAYPIVRLPGHVLVVDFVRRLEEAMIATCADFGVATARVPGRSGVWLRADELRVERKVGAIGLRVAQGVTMHGIALNCDVDLGWYDRFVPCGIADAGVTTLSLATGRAVGVHDVLPVLQTRLAQLLAWAPYAATPDYEPRPDPARREPRIELVRP